MTTNEQERFSMILANFQHMGKFWDESTKQFDTELLKKEIKHMAYSENITARWLANLWNHDQVFDFDVILDIHFFDEKSLKIFSEWTADPFYP